MTALMDMLSLKGLEHLIRGPLVWVAFVVFIVGLVFQCVRMMRLTRKRKMPPRIYKKPQTTKRFSRRMRDGLVFLRVSVLGATPCMAVISFIFHTCLILTPFLVTAHSVLLDTSFGLSFVSLSERTTDGLTLIVLFCGIFFLTRRMAVRRVRAISGPADFILLAVAIGPFLTGFLAYHHLFNYQLMVTLHVLSGEIMLVMIPFSRFSHMIFFFISRFLIAGEHSRKSASRVWQFAGANSR
jgi:nitrate reductase gamma subunit